MRTTEQQAQRELVLKSPYGKSLSIRALSGEEAIGEAFCYTLQLFSDRLQRGIDPSTVLGQVFSVVCRQHGREIRQFNGIVSHFEWLAHQTRPHTRFHYCYRAELRPRFWRLMLRQHCRVFHDRSVLEILRQVFDEHQLSVVDRCQPGRYAKLEHCVQFNETDHDFCRRLMERDGIYFFFQHKAGQDLLVLADSQNGHRDLLDTGTLAMTLSVNNWRSSQGLLVALQPAALCDAVPPGSQGTAGALQAYSAHAGKMMDERYAAMQFRIWQARHSQVEADSLHAGLHAGGRFKLIGHQQPRDNRSYLVTRVSLLLSNQHCIADPPDSREHCHFAAVPVDSGYHLPVRTPLPSPPGPQTARVLGQPEGAVPVDINGRIQVEFQWERGPGTPPQRCWVRVNQHWAGRGWGGMLLPRAGQEVLIDFINGDVDQPLVIGCLNNGNNSVSSPLPAKPLVSTIRGQGGQGRGHNEIRFTDQLDNEQLFIRAEKNLKHYVRQDAQTWIGSNLRQEVRNDAYQLIQHHSLLEVGKSLHVRVGEESRFQVGKNISIKGNDGLALKLDKKLQLAGEEVSVQAEAGLVLEANTAISLKVGDSFIRLTPSGVFVSGPVIELNCGGAATSASMCCPDMPMPVPALSPAAYEGLAEVGPALPVGEII